MQDKIIYFCLIPGKFAADYREQVILLDIIKNEYLSLNEEAGEYLTTILTDRFCVCRRA